MRKKASYLKKLICGRGADICKQNCSRQQSITCKASPVDCQILTGDDVKIRWCRMVVVKLFEGLLNIVLLKAIPSNPQNSDF